MDLKMGTNRTFIPFAATGSGERKHKYQSLTVDERVIKKRRHRQPCKQSKHTVEMWSSKYDPMLNKLWQMFKQQCRRCKSQKYKRGRHMKRSRLHENNRKQAPSPFLIFWMQRLLNRQPN